MSRGLWRSRVAKLVSRATVRIRKRSRKRELADLGKKECVVAGSRRDHGGTEQEATERRKQLAERSTVPDVVTEVGRRSHRVQCYFPMEGREVQIACLP